MLYVGRLSEEKGVLELPLIFQALRYAIPDVQIAIAGTGPSEGTLREEMPEAIFLGWLPAERLAQVYAAADVLLFPSRFDTFGCVVLEALSCGLPVVAYPQKGPKDLLEGESAGFLCETSNDLCHKAMMVLRSPSLRRSMRQAALKRASEFSSENILQRLLKDLGLTRPPATDATGSENKRVEDKGIMPPTVAHGGQR
jgi:glycosyltransferase involved in cell wall biosynthesis